MHQPGNNGKYKSSLFPMHPSAPGGTGSLDGGGPPRASHAPSSPMGDGPLKSSVSAPTTPPVSPGASPPAPEPPEFFARPRRRADCLNGPRPCPWIGCRWHLCWERRDLRRLIMSNADPALVAARIMEMDPSCVLDFTGAPRSDREVGAVLEVSHQAVAQTCQRGLAKLRAKQVLKRGRKEALQADAPPAWRWSGEGGGGSSPDKEDD